MEVVTSDSGTRKIRSGKFGFLWVKSCLNVVLVMNFVFVFMFVSLRILSVG